MKTPTWGEVEEFCRKDGWKLVRETNHSFFRKILSDGTVLETHTSFSSGKTMSEGRFALILRSQLQVSSAAFWETLRTGQPAARPSAPLPTVARALPAWVVRTLIEELHLSEQQVAALDEAAARRRIDMHRSKPHHGRPDRTRSRD